MQPKAPLVFILSIVLLMASCTPAAAQPELPIAPITVGDDLSAIDLCAAIPPEDIETVMGVKLVEPPTRYLYNGAQETSGCYYEGPTDSDRERHFGYVILTPLHTYDSQPLFQNEEVPGIGDGAYFNKGPDARQLWVKVDDKVAFVVAFGDVAKEEGAKAIARLMVEAIQ